VEDQESPPSDAEVCRMISRLPLHVRRPLEDLVRSLASLVEVGN
jgi:hypothetical protein